MRFEIGNFHLSWNGKTSAPAPAPTVTLDERQDRDGREVSRGLTPEQVDAILTQASSAGLTADQCQLSQDLEEKNWDIAQAMQTRRLAVGALDWRVLPGDDTPAAKHAAETLQAQLDSCPGQGGWTFQDLITSGLIGAAIPGFACAEILWETGRGRLAIAGFKEVEARHLSFEGGLRAPLLKDSGGALHELPPHKFILHRHRARGGDLARGGLIRPLAWLHVFGQLGGMKELLRFIERHGMPFIVAKVSQQAWENDRAKLRSLVRNFGSDGGALFTDAVQVELLQAANTGGDVYFKLLQYTADAITKVILGQTASSGDSAGLSGGDAQSRVRRDILEADAKLISATLTAQLARPWSLFNYGPAVPAPKISAVLDESEDLVQTSTILVNLKNAGFSADPAEISERFGFQLVGVPAAPLPAMGPTIPTAPPADTTALTATTPTLPPSKNPLAALMQAAADPAISDAALLDLIAKTARQLPATADPAALAQAFEHGMLRAAIAALAPDRQSGQ